MDAIVVNENNGYYQIPANAEPEAWHEIKKHGHIKRQESLIGWGEYTASYTLEMPHQTVWYFVAEQGGG